ncbi:uncharacterized protein LOC117107891 [Anneissia japonica]|uniref:uncharacterized protein LOC117107891 n=1 Tax=Anneissia japonica TaxID=1529436 RepID=UPI001425B6CD|nr:uncharacterized protein LOC117107891 [Anneissia japonica]XP_033105616.1 uncharacterized protein LOC117107891 [Anneissia japonica]
MGNVQVQDFAPVRPDERRELNLGCRVTPQLYQQHVDGAAVEGALTELPWSIVDSVSLFEEMDVSFNELTRIPPEIPLRLPHLSTVNLSHNRLTSLPDSFALLFHLKNVLLHHNQIQSLPKTFIHLVKLEKLDLSFNSLMSLPDNIGQMESLKKLNISDNQLHRIPISLGGSKQMNVLLAFNNQCLLPPQSICNEGSDALLSFLRLQFHNGNIPKVLLPGNIFQRVRGNVLNSSVGNPHSARAQYLQEQTQTTNTTSRIRTPLRPTLGATTLDADELRDKIVGLVYGAAIGDALGLCTENLTRDECLFYYEEDDLNYKNSITDKHRLQWDKGDWSADFDQMALLLDSILHWAGVVDELDFAKRLFLWSKHGFPDLGDTKGYEEFSNAVAKALHHKQFTKKPHDASQEIWERAYEPDDPESCDHLADNGALVRTAILGIPHFHDIKEVSSNAVRICRATHYDPRCRASCVVVSAIIASILQNSHPLSNTKHLNALLSSAIELGKEQLQSPKHKDQLDKYCCMKTFGQVVTCDNNKPSLTFKPLAVTLVALRSKLDFKTALSKIIMYGADSNSNACVAGAVLGCLYGYQSLPKAWVQGLQQKNAKWLDIRINAFLDLMALP